ncbi:MAG: SemiSWEET family transporter [Planctomycetes bacterium]|nr:SemiSWEET family transporter [Planctomycetota bacterium]
MNEHSAADGEAAPGIAERPPLVATTPHQAAVGARGVRRARTRAFDAYMIAVGILGNGIFFVQAYTIFGTKSAKDVSLAAFGIALWAAASWLVYGVHLGNRVVIIANVLAVAGSAAVIVGKLIYS